jgi:spoIIIJ-associated protein
VIERLDVGPFQISESEEGELIVCEIRGDAAAALAIGDGRPVDALQLLVNQAALRRSEDAKRVVLEVEGNAVVREDFLSSLVDRVIRRATDGGRAVALDPMSGKDRRIIHLAVREREGVATMSIGEGRYRQVVVVPEGAPEYEEALQQSEAASQSE